MVNENESSSAESRQSRILAILERFNFDKVLTAMTALSWEWVQRDGSYKIPTIGEMKETAIYLLEETEKHNVISTGGFRAEKDKDGVLNLSFVLEEETSDV